jgi:N-acetylneuraminic acid mutarotase
MDPRTLATRLIPRDASAPRDHSQLVAFQGELWMIGGRDLFTGIQHPRVSIFDPASETWRPGPSLQNSRAGFAAAASSALLMVAGGERLVGQRGVLNSAEAIVPGAQQWTSMPAMPAAVHGVGGILYKNAFYAIGGSLLAGGVLNQGDVQVFRWGP